MPNVMGWDTQGVTDLGLLDDGRMKLAFTGTDGATKNIFIPFESVGQLVSSLIAFSAKAAALHGTRDTISGQHMLGVKHMSLGSDDAGKEFRLALKTGDDLELRFSLDQSTTLALAEALNATLSKHGIAPPLGTPAVGSRH